MAKVAVTLLLNLSRFLDNYNVFRWSEVTLFFIFTGDADNIQEGFYWIVK